MVQRIDTRCDLMLFGALGDLAQRKLFPALYQLERAGLLAEGSRVLAIARAEGDTDSVRRQLYDRLQQHVKPVEFDPEMAHRFLARVAYLRLDFNDPEGFYALGRWRHPTDNELIVYMATPPSLYGVIARNLRAASCCNERTRVVVEKPIGHDLESSRVINDELGEVYNENQIFRIDHYLGKETVQNLIALRFANNLFASQWDQNHISHVEITVAESVGIEGRWGYFDKAGQIRDMVQNHLLQLLCLIAMDPPADLSADSIRDEKVKVLKALRTITPDMMERYVVRGQYTAGTSGGKPVPGYLDEEGANRNSDTETFVALKAEIENWRWSGVPFYIRTGKRLPEKLSQIIIHFKPAPHYIFDPDQKHLANNKLIIRLQPDEGMSLKILTKDQGLDKGMRLRQGPLELTFSETFETERIPDAYERLLWEIMKGNQYLFVRRDEVEYAWRWVDQVIRNWKDSGEPPKRYAAGTWGPVASIAMITRDGRSWYEDV
ncbi:glucose-6-phosphate dehydrogenase [Marinobacter lutaoensis]|jgi:glucose-6-phosphate 1-dehydrogenase|uniref:Glucose-6-phosphate 1-dehydrogenase n=1 Tax=Marinobacter lutaoensis TaxID=135739 RepID=A0A1V2DXQ0_9GAMM|nr:glucose-6-phosphate dehydrogenase [Marinobacter lutaoensis]MBE03400.1 glucose-6-phosphate dehydrogenase [Marinobacter sp.]MBI42613.1 glucose-6-phosphate dehydrogenase [Oceanospirillales bacterium]ONF45279.1 glucose-6-phosphate dehydrogenase [Marinobacter lutaoensis]|tara:strand:+ start:7446 stop:8921 length:1476 start_codon:yes stop_codon:yes gene_type:complete